MSIIDCHRQTNVCSDTSIHRITECQMMPNDSDISMEDPLEWMLFASCAGQRMYYETVGAHNQPLTPADRKIEQQALMLCRKCLVLSECREWSLQHPDPAFDHVAGGLTPRERFKIRKQQ